jgi:BrnA antitoxin of type II toxin-antitoxin system
MAKTPTVATTKVAISIRLRRDTLATYRRTGKGWQTRLSDDLDRLARAYGRPSAQLAQLQRFRAAVRRSGLLEPESR